MIPPIYIHFSKGPVELVYYDRVHPHLLDDQIACNLCYVNVEYLTPMRANAMVETRPGDVIIDVQPICSKVVLSCVTCNPCKLIFK